MVFSGEMNDLRRDIEMTKGIIRSQKLHQTPDKKVKELRDHIKKLEAARNERMEFVVWKDFPERLDENITRMYLQRFRQLPEQFHEESQFVNVTMFGGVGVGKSSFLNTVVTALMDKNRIYRDYLTSPLKTSESKTKTFQLEKLRMDGGKVLPIRFYDCPGIDKDEDVTMNLDVLEAVINGHVKGDSKFNPVEIRNKYGESYRKDPTFKNAMHCVVFVIKATTNILEPDDETLKKMKDIQGRINGPRKVRQLAIVTYIDEIGVPNTDMENVFKYSCVKDICNDVAKFLQMDLQSVHPVANYHEDNIPNAAKNALSLMALWDIVECGERHIQKKYEKRFEDDY
uniref:Interferon-induced protein 44-like isoform X2 n=1 Tax=Crassostrea virginica TaxID=6565 RepID=A0A8B8C0Z8_CRAVI|nr:interferon-induced protein 44-like isoform X2 [Crassostrea virginica]